MNKELNQIKKIYGEEMMHICRDLFPSLIENEGLLLSILKNNVAPTRSLASDIKEYCLYSEFKSFIYSFVDVENECELVTNKTPFELMDEAGYTLYECKCEEDIQSFRKYYQTNEVLCTITQGRRLERNYVFFAVKKNVDMIKRKNFTNPQREDEYGTSVISIQFSRGKSNFLSIKNRYNHTVNNPDATFSNNLNNIIPGLKSSFEKYYQLNINQNDNNESSFLTSILNYVKANDGRFYRYNVEINGIYYCENNVIIKDGNIINEYTNNKERYLLFEEYIIDRKDKKIYSLENSNDSFVESITEVGEIKYIDIKKNEQDKVINIIYSNGKQTKIVVNKSNAIIEYENNNILKIGNYFLKNNEQLSSITLPKVQTIGDRFLLNNEQLSDISLPQVKTIGNLFLYNNAQLSSITLPEVQTIGDDFLSSNKQLRSITLPQVEALNNNFLYLNKQLEYISIPKVKTIGDYFLSSNKQLSSITLPEVQTIGNYFLDYNEQLRSITLPMVNIIGIGCLYANKELYNEILLQIEKNTAKEKVLQLKR